MSWDAGRAREYFAVPDASSHKYRRGVLGLRTGSAAYPGAAVLGAEGAWRTGVGLVRYSPPLDDPGSELGLPSPAAAVLAARPETVFADGETALGAQCDAWLVGSGTDPARRSFAKREALHRLFDGETPLVVDAGALPEIMELSPRDADGSPRARALSTTQAPTLPKPHTAVLPAAVLPAPHAAVSPKPHARVWPGPHRAVSSMLRAPVVLTPHLGEFRALWAAAMAEPGGDTPPVPDNRVAAAAALASRLGATVLLKGSESVVATPGGFRALVGPATPWLATAGTGDVLAGILGALVATHAAGVRADPELLGPLAATAARLHDAAARFAADDLEGDGNGHPITALDVAHAVPAAVSAMRA